MSDSFADDIIAFLPNLRRFALSLCRQADLADDLVQITVERAFRGRDQFDPATRLDAWLFRILRNAWIDMVRRKKTQGIEIDIDDAADARVVDGTQTVETSLMLQSAKQAMAELPDDQREVMMLICVEEMSYKEAAQILDAPIGTVMSRLSRARITIAKKLGINAAPARSSDSEQE
ncbi:RNA polymerase sigma factor [Sulfitobacter sp. 1151]|uniref:RNA polymerase sigma factor n=2 Tax=Parasulfitobacter algicola TaxID=2614809 RepID=A0ABX2IVP8_9RHOB|nr:RNA polymerase sigma factor [Sulfitobacter algicola]NSX54444.1 RNA polymerase sigma factor [Sulfitobacter algicola]